MIKKYLLKQQVIFVLTLLSILFTNTIYAQVVDYPFNGNLNNVVNSVNGTSLEWVNETPIPSTPSYVTTPSGGQGIDLATNQYVLMDDSFMSLIASDDSFELDIDFRYTYTGPVSDDSEGRKPIYGSKLVGNQSPGLTMETYRSSATTFDIYLGFSDGNEETIAYFIVNPVPLNINEEINISLKIDYEAKSWFFKANDIYNFDFFAESFDMDIFKNALQTIPAYIGWQENYGFDMDFHGYNGTMIIDHFKLHVPARPADIVALQTALQQMTDYILGNISLTQAEIDAHTTTVILNHQKSYTNAQTEIDNYLAAFEANFDALFTNRDEAPSLSSLPNEERIAYFLIQDIFDNEFVAGNMANMAGVSFREGNIYPGPVSSTAPRVNNAQAVINCTYIEDPGMQLVDGNLGVIRPIGYYAAPGELITVTVPEALVNKGIKIIAGAHTDQSSLDGMRRLQRISKAIDITSTATQIVNPFGGALYFKIPQELNEGWQTVTINGAVKSPYFRMLSGQPQNISEWVTDLNNGYVKWADIESDKMMFTLPTSMIGVTNLTNIMTKWGEMIDLVNTVAGRPLNPIRSEYVLVDCIGGVGAAGYPKLMEENTYDEALPSTYWSPLRILEEDFVETNQGFIFHELGHNLLFPIPDGHVETVVQMFSVPSYFVLTNDLEKSISYAEDETYGRDTGAIAWMITPEFRNNMLMEDEHARYQVRGGAKWFDIVDLFSWEDLGKLNKFFYDKWTTEGGASLGNSYVENTEYLQAATERIGVNMTPLLNFWGMIPTAGEITTYANYPESCEIYNRLVYYRNLVPQTQSEFLPWRDLLLNQVDEVHHDEINDIYSNYDAQNIGDQIITQIDYLLATYYLNGACQSFQTTWTVTDLDTTITIPTNTTNYTYNYQVDWNGDGDYVDANETTAFTGDATHDFGTAGTYTINIKGDFPAIYFNNAGDKNKIRIVNRWGAIKWHSMQDSFYGCSNISIVDTAGIPDLSNVNSINGMFRNSGIDTTGSLNDWDVSNVANFRNVFRNANGFNQSLEKWDISNATAMNNMFNGITLSTKNYDATLIGWNTLTERESQIPINIDFHGGNSKYCLSNTQRTQLTTATGPDGGYGWVITDSNILECEIKMAPLAFLEGAFVNTNTGEEYLMRDDLRAMGLLPTTSPYADGVMTTPTIFTVEGNNAIVDWVWVELREAASNTVTSAGQSALLQRDGDIVGTDGFSNLIFTVPHGDYYIVVKHRNHLGIMTSSTMSLTDTITRVDFTDAIYPITYGTDGQTIFGMPNGVVAMWSGDTNGDGQLNYLGASSDIPAIRSKVFNDPDNSLFGGPPVGSYPSAGYSTTDIDMDGVTVYSGAASDVLHIRNNIFNNPSNSVFGGPPTATYIFTQQLPEGGNN